MSLAQRTSRFTRTGLAPYTVPPALRRVAAAGLAAAAVSLAADLVLVAVGRAVFTVPASFGKFAFGTYALLTVLGVAGATGAWALVTRLSSRPQWLPARTCICRCGTCRRSPACRCSGPSSRSRSCT